MLNTLGVGGMRGGNGQGVFLGNSAMGNPPNGELGGGQRLG
jgi:hypothetical protein